MSEENHCEITEIKTEPAEAPCYNEESDEAYLKEIEFVPILEVKTENRQSDTQDLYKNCNEDKFINTKSTTPNFNNKLNIKTEECGEEKITIHNHKIDIKEEDEECDEIITPNNYNHKINNNEECDKEQISNHNLKIDLEADDEESNEEQPNKIDINTEKITNSTGNGLLNKIRNQFKQNLRKTNYTSSLVNSTRARTECKICGKTYLTSFIKEHVKNHTKEKLFHCDLCPKRFFNKTRLIDHANTHSKQVLYECLVCKKSYYNKESYLNHRRSHRLYRCKLCEGYIESDIKFNDHKKKCLKKLLEPSHEEQTYFKCDVCDKIFTHERNWVTHQNTHSKQVEYKCNNCDKKYYHKASYVSHMMRHNKCKWCGEFTKDPAHKKECSYKEKLKCELCDEIFASDLNTERPYKCPSCKTTTALKRQMKDRWQKVFSTLQQNNS